MILYENRSIDSQAALSRYFFSGIVVFIGIRFYLFVACLEKGQIPGFERPAGVEAFLPISALLSLKHWVYTGTINSIHPAALVLFLIICATAIVAKKGFAAGSAPLASCQRGAAKLNRELFKTPLKLPAVFDIALRSLKYVIAGFFVYQILYRMPPGSIAQFIHSPYNQFADIKMLKFFSEMSVTALAILMALFFLTLVVRNFWCRYLCPYGALLGIMGLLSLGKIHRQPSHCIGCGRCETICPGRIAIRQKKRIFSPECSACMGCIETCPKEEALTFKLGSRKVGPIAMAGFFCAFVYLWHYHGQIIRALAE